MNKIKKYFIDNQDLQSIESIQSVETNGFYESYAQDVSHIEALVQRLKEDIEFLNTNSLNDPLSKEIAKESEQLAEYMVLQELLTIRSKCLILIYFCEKNELFPSPVDKEHFKLLSFKDRLLK